MAGTTRNAKSLYCPPATPEFPRRWGSFALDAKDVAVFRRALEQHAGGPAAESDAEITQMAYNTILALAVLSHAARAAGKVLVEPPATPMAGSEIQPR